MSMSGMLLKCVPDAEGKQHIGQRVRSESPDLQVLLYWEPWTSVDVGITHSGAVLFFLPLVDCHAVLTISINA